MRRVVAASLLAIVATWTVASFPALGAPSNTKISSVTTWPGNATVQSGDAVTKDIEIEAESTGSLGLTWIRIDARLGTSGDWVCLQQWDLGGAGSDSRTFRWNTKVWPDAGASSYGCPSSFPSTYPAVRSDGKLTENGTYNLRAVARENVSASYQQSSIFTVKVNNLPTAPTWASDPKVTRDAKGSPLVELKWYQSPEPDIVEYIIMRDGPSNVQQFVVSASSPGGQGCSKSGTVYTCTDDYFPKPYGGEYMYTLYATRSSPVTGKVSSPASYQQDAAVDEPSPSPSPSTGGGSNPPTSTPGGGSGGSGGGGFTPTPSTPGSSSPSVRGTRSSDDREFFTGAFDEQLPYDDRGGFDFLPGDGTGTSTPGQGTGLIDETLAADDSGSRLADVLLDRRIATSIAAGLLMVLVSMHVVRLLFDR